MARPRRSGLLEKDIVLEKAVRAKKNSASIPRSMEEYSVSAINLRRGDWRFLRRVAEARSDLRGGRASVSKVIEALIESNRTKLQSEIKSAMVS
jgi:hypothetical protein